jgi:hypothetical protein
MALTISASPRPSTSLLIRSAAACAAAGVGLSLTDYAGVGKWLAVVGVVLMIVGLHRFGRTGPDEAIVFQLEPAKKKKRKKKLEGAAAVSEPGAPALPPESESSDGL